MDFDTHFSYVYNDNTMYALLMKHFMDESKELHIEHPAQRVLGSITDERDGRIVKTHGFLSDSKGPAMNTTSGPNRNYRKLLEMFLKDLPLPSDHDENSIHFG